jgi:hypothetical protein
VGNVYDEIGEKLARWIEQQHVFFVGRRSTRFGR